MIAPDGLPWLEIAHPLNSQMQLLGRSDFDNKNRFFVLVCALSKRVSRAQFAAAVEEWEFECVRRGYGKFPEPPLKTIDDLDEFLDSLENGDDES